MTTSREACFEALLSSYKEEKFVADVLANWRRETKPKPEDYRLAQEIAHGTVRMTRALDALARQLADTRRLKLKEKVLLRMALYQHQYMDKIPLYAIVNESVALAKKKCHPTFVKFLNAILRKLENIPLTLPDDPGIALSYPDYLIQMLAADYGTEQSMEILHWGNRPAPAMARDRDTGNYHIIDSIEPYANDPQYYIQNKTPGMLFRFLQEQLIRPPKSILDLCAAPGGKSLLLYDAFPEAQLTSNDISEEKAVKIRENFQKYGIKGEVSVSQGQNLKVGRSFDLIVIDAPCSNTGVLNKRSEARWRLSEENLQKLQELQQALIKNAAAMLEDDGQIWFMTCSILKQENEHVVSEACSRYGLGSLAQKTILPDSSGSDGGFAAAMRKLTSTSYAAG